MSRRGALTYLLVAFLLGAAYFSATRWEARKVERESLEKRVFDLKQADVTSLRIRRAGEPEIAIARSLAGAAAEQAPAGPWEITAPRALPADQAAVSSVVEALLATEKLRALEGSGLDPAEYGLDAPALLVWAGTGSERRGIAFGEENISRDARYARLEGGEEIFLVPAYAFNQMDRGLELLRDRRLLPLSRSALRAITIARGQGRFTLRKQDGRWQFEDDPRPVSETAVGGLIGALTETRVERFVTEEETGLASYGLDTPDVTVTFDAEGAEEAWLRVAAPAEGAPAGDVLAARSSAPGVVALPARFLDRIPHSPAALEDRVLLRAEIADARAVTVTGRGGTGVRFIREGEAWRSEEAGKDNEGGDTEAPDVGGLLTLLQELQHDGAPAGKNPGDGETEITLRVETGEGASLFDLEIRREQTEEEASVARLTDADGAREVIIPRFTRETLYDKLRELRSDLVAAPGTAEAGEG